VLCCVSPEAVCGCLCVKLLQGLTHIMSKQVVAGSGPLHNTHSKTQVQIHILITQSTSIA